MKCKQRSTITSKIPPFVFLIKKLFMTAKIAKNDLGVKEDKKK
jgi:hypothetical protein